MKHLTKRVMSISLLAGCLFAMPAGILLAAGASSPIEQSGMEQDESKSNLREGSFDGYDKQAGLIWVNDMVFQLTDKLNVIGTSKKVGLLSDMQQGEPVILLFEDRGSRQIPLAIELRRQ